MILTPARAAHTREQNPAVQDRIRSLLADMPSAVARVAEYLLKHPQAPLTLSIGELAEQAGASAATVTRFCRMIGYPGYVELRVGIATDVGRRSASRDSWSSEIGRAFGPDDSPGGPAADADQQPHQACARGDLGYRPCRDHRGRRGGSR